MTSHSRCRIGRVKMKSGAEVRILDGDRGGDPDVVSLLMEMLQKARRGEIESIAIVTVDPNGTVGSCWEQGAAGNFHQLSSGALMLACRFGEPD